MNDDLSLALHDAADAAERWAPPADPVAALRTRRARTRLRRRLQVTAGALLALTLVGQALLPPPAMGAERPVVLAAAP